MRLADPSERDNHAFRQEKRKVPPKLVLQTIALACPSVLLRVVALATERPGTATPTLGDTGDVPVLVGGGVGVP